MPPSCDHKTDQVAVGRSKEAAWLPWSFKGGTQDVQQSPWTPWSPWSFERVQLEQSQKGRRGGWSLNGRSKEAEGTQRHRRGCRMDAQWPVNDRLVIYMCSTAKLSPSMLSFKGGTKVAGAVTQKQDSLGLGDYWASWSYFGSLKGGTKVAALCKGGFSNFETHIKYRFLEQILWIYPHWNDPRPH